MRSLDDPAVIALAADLEREAVVPWPDGLEVNGACAVASVHDGRTFYVS